jgi:hypothetical protein
MRMLVMGYWVASSWGLMARPPQPPELFSLKSSWPGYGRVNPSTIRVNGNVVWLSSREIALAAYDVSDPLKPIWMGGLDLNDSSRTHQTLDCELMGDYIYLTGFYLDRRPGYPVYGGYLHVVDSHDAQKPRLVASLACGGRTSMQIRGGFLYRTASPDFWPSLGDEDFEILDLKFPEKPEVVGRCSIPISWGNQLESFTVSDEFAYVSTLATTAGGTNALIVVDIRDRKNPKVTSTLDWPDAGTLCLTSTALVLRPHNRYDVVEVLALDDPLKPDLSSQIYGRDIISIGEAPGGIWLGGSGGTIDFYDLSDPSAPKREAEVKVAGRAISGQLQEDRLWIADAGGGFAGIDVSDANQPKLIHQELTGGRSGEIAIEGNYAYLNDGFAGLRILDISDVGNLREVGHAKTALFSSMHVENGFCYLASDGITVVDARSPGQPRIMVITNSGPTGPMHFESNIIYLASYKFMGTNTETTVGIYEVSNATNIEQRGSIEFLRGISGVTMVPPHFLYLSGEKAITVMDVSKPTSPRLVSETANHTDWMFGDGAVRGTNLFYLGNAGLETWDVSEPGGPRFQNAIEVTKGVRFTGVFSMKLEIQGDYIFVAAWDSELKAYYAGNPAAPVLAGKLMLPELSYVRAHGNYLFTGDGAYGLGVVSAPLTNRIPLKLPIPRLEGNILRFALDLERGRRYSMAGSTNMSSWQNVTNIVGASTPVNVSVPRTEAKKMFLRLEY